MSKVQHTPGPWTFKDAPGAGLQIWAAVDLGQSRCEATDQATGPRLQPVYEATAKPQLYVGDDGTVTAVIAYESWRQFPTVAFDEMQRANARLIAAAPELLQAARNALAFLDVMEFERDGDAYAASAVGDVLTAAIEKAEGE